jgi:hypothetical protein
MRSWQQQHVRAAGRAAAYAAIRHEAPGETPEYLSHPALSKHERRNTACMRTQCASYVAAHAQHRKTAMFGPPVAYARRHCQCGPCKRTNTTDSTAHVMLHCAAHATDRSEMINSENRSLSIAATTRVRTAADTPARWMPWARTHSNCNYCSAERTFRTYETAAPNTGKYSQPAQSPSKQYIAPGGIATPAIRNERRNEGTWP